MDLSKASTEELERELAYRRGKEADPSITRQMAGDTSASADRPLGEECPPHSSTYQQMVGVYKEFMEGQQVPFFMDGVQGKALKAIIKKLRAVTTIKNDDEKMLNAWRFIFRHWDRTGDFIGKQKSLVNINRNLTEVLDKIRNGHNKQATAAATNEQLRLSLTGRRHAGGDQAGG